MHAGAILFAPTAHKINMEKIPNTNEELVSMKELQDYFFLNGLGGGIIDGKLTVIIPSTDMRLEQVKDYLESFEDIEIIETETEPQNEHEKGLLTIHTFVISQK